MTPEQEAAIRAAGQRIVIERARERMREQQPEQAAAPAQGQPQERGFWAAVGDNIFGFDDGVTSPGERLGTWLNRAGESATLGLAGDEAGAAMYSLIPGRTYDGELQRLRDNEAGMSTAGRVSADLAGAIVPAVAGVGAVGTAARGLGGRMLAGAGAGASAGALNGFMEGEGGAAQRGISAGIGGTAGAFLGGAIPAAAEIGRSAWRMGTGALRDRAVGRAVGDRLGVSPETGRFVSTVVGSEDPAAMAEALRRAGPRAMMGDASASLAGHLDAAVRTPVPAAQEAHRRIADRAGAAFTDLADALRGGRQGPEQSPASLMESIRRGTSGARQTAYDAAYAAPIDYSSAAGSRLLDRVTPRLPPEAISYANRLMRVRGERSSQIMASIADDGSVTFTRPPDVRQWDYIRQALGQLAESGDGAGALGGQTRMGAAYENLSREIRDNVASLVPEYQTALNTAADAIGRRNAVQFGTELLSTRRSTGEVLEQIATATSAERQAMREGIIGQIEELAGNVHAVASDQNIDARQALDLYRRLSSLNSQRRLEALFGEDWPAISEQIQRTGVALGLRAAVARNSQTAGRQITDSIITDITAPHPLQQGRLIEGARDIVGETLGAGPNAMASLNRQVRGEIADLFTRQNGTPQTVLEAVSQAMAARPENFNAGGNMAAALGLLGYGGLPTVTNGLAELMRR